jgi:hypothetical protein
MKEHLKESLAFDTKVGLVQFLKRKHRMDEVFQALGVVWFASARAAEDPSTRMRRRR